VGRFAAPAAETGEFGGVPLTPYREVMALVDWEMAVATGAKLAPGGPDVSLTEAHAVVEQLGRLAAASVPVVAEATGMYADPSDTATVVVDRPEWIASNVRGFRTIMEPLEQRMVAEGRGGSALAGKAGAAELGGVLAWISTKVLGQFEALTPPGERSRLMLVAPNILHTERALGLRSTDFRMWVCLHEETHRVQFGAVPWLADHFRAEIDTFLAGVQTGAMDTVKRLGSVLAAVARVLAGASGATIVDAAQTPVQKQVFDRLTALMSLLEGHAEHVMDAAGPSVIPSLVMIRERFDQRRAKPGAADGLMRRLLGMDTKLKQYSDGRVFVDHVVAEVGMAGFNRVWTSPNTLPTRQEIADPAAWVRRMS